MPKHLFRYANQEAFESDNEKLDELNHFTAVKDAEDESEFKDWYIRPEFKPISESKAADICLVDNGGNKYIVDGTSYSTDIFPAEQYTPIGVVVVPGAHTEDGTARIISLKVMDYNNPDNGNDSGHILILWGGYNYDVPGLDYKTMSPCIAEDIRTIEGEQQIVNWYDIFDVTNCLPSDHLTVYPNPYDEGTYYSNDTVDRVYKAMPSPYLTDGLKNEIYHSTANTGNALADMDGRVNTAAILAVDNSASTDWQTAETIDNSDGRVETLHPAAQCCWRYHTTGTTQGEWYLPSAGELGYLSARLYAIEASFQKVRDAGFVAVSLPDSDSYWSSTESLDDCAVFLSFFFDLNGMELTYYSKGLDHYVRAFLAVG